MLAVFGTNFVGARNGHRIERERTRERERKIKSFTAPLLPRNMDGQQKRIKEGFPGPSGGMREIISELTNELVVMMR